MRTLILATVSVIALGLGSASPLYAADNSTTTAPMAQPPATAPAAETTQPGMPSVSSAAQPATPSMSGTAASQSNSPYAANTGSSQSAAPTESQIREAQQKLQQDNLYSGKIDGIMGGETEQALRQYQKKNGLPETAKLDQQTVNSLLVTGSQSQGSSMPPSSTTGMTPSSASGDGASNSANHWKSAK